LADFKIPPLGGEASQDNAVIQDMLTSKTLLVPTPDADTCTACGVCVEQRPAEALSLPEDLPRVDMDRGVTCFCCQEICPEKAMPLQ
jgi:ferredoxin